MADPDPTDDRVHQAEAIVAMIRPLLAGHPPEVQGAVLVDLLATWIAGHHPALRDEILAIHIATVRKLIPENELEIFARRGGKPPGWEPS